MIEYKSDRHDTKKFTYRFYEDEYPADDQLCIGVVSEVQENGCYVDLVEYGGKRAMITPNYYTKEMLRLNVHRVMRVGKQEVVRVMKVDREKGYIDLSKKKVTKDEVTDKLDRFAKAKTVNSIMRTLSESMKVDLETIFKKIAWPMYKKNEQPLQIMIESIEKESELDFLNLDKDMKDHLIAEIRRRFQPARVRIMAVFEISVNQFEGVNIIKEALSAGYRKSKPYAGFNIEITILGAPVYLIAVYTDRKEEAKNLVNEALLYIKTFIYNQGGLYKLKSEPKVVGDKNQHLYEFNLAGQKPQVEDNSDESGMGSASYSDNYK